jgi:acyl dehydratase
MPTAHPSPSIEVGDTGSTQPFTIQAGDFALLQSVSWLLTELHTNEEYMRTKSQFGHRIMSGPINFALISGLWYTDLGGPFAERHGIRLGAVKRVEMRFRRPLMVGDTIVVESKVESVRQPSASGEGEVVFADRGVNQRGETAIESRRWMPFSEAR